MPKITQFWKVLAQNIEQKYYAHKFLFFAVELFFGGFMFI